MKAEKVMDGNDDLVLCSIKVENKIKEKETKIKKKVRAGSVSKVMRSKIMKGY